MKFYLLIKFLAVFCLLLDDQRLEAKPTAIDTAENQWPIKYRIVYKISNDFEESTRIEIKEAFDQLENELTFFEFVDQKDQKENDSNLIFIEKNDECISDSEIVDLNREDKIEFYSYCITLNIFNQDFM